MKVASLVPSITETLIEAGVDVVARSRFCIHPADRVSSIPSVGGTKDLDVQGLLKSGAEILVLDREENTKPMAEKSPIPIHALHIQSVADLPGSFEGLAHQLGAPGLKEIADRWRSALQVQYPSLLQPPALIQWIEQGEFEQVMYLIWRKPWMAVRADTFIGSMMELCGWPLHDFGFATKYPSLEGLDQIPDNTLLLFSSEPYPFAKHLEDIKALGRPSALVDGESLSWFGVRSLRFLDGLNPNKL